MLKGLKEMLSFKGIAREPISKIETYLKFGVVITETERHYCPRCGHRLNVGPDYQCRYCDQCGQRLTLDRIKWKEEKELRCVPYEQRGGIYVNRSKIEWCDHTWNPVTGCRHNCPYCYAKRMTARFAGDVRLNLMAKKDYSTVPAADGGDDLYVLDKPMMNETENALVYPFGFEPTLHRYRMNVLDKLKMGNNIFVGAMADIFGAWVPDEWIREVIGYCVDHPAHNYLFLTKNPKRYIQYGVPSGFENMWYGTSVTREMETEMLDYLPEHCRTFVSIEPILEDIRPMEHRKSIEGVDWIILGAETGRKKGCVIPEWDWIKNIVLEADSLSIPVFMKESLVGVVGEENMRREFPSQLQRSVISKKMEKKLYGDCAVCNSHLKKGEMITLLARSRRGEQPKQFGFMCKNCFKRFCEDLNLDIPELIGLAESITIVSGDGDG